MITVFQQFLKNDYQLRKEFDFISLLYTIPILSYTASINHSTYNITKQKYKNISSDVDARIANSLF